MAVVSGEADHCQLKRTRGQLLLTLIWGRRSLLVLLCGSLLAEALSVELQDRGMVD